LFVKKSTNSRPVACTAVLPCLRGHYYQPLRFFPLCVNNEQHMPHPIEIIPYRTFEDQISEETLRTLGNRRFDDLPSPDSYQHQNGGQLLGVQPTNGPEIPEADKAILVIPSWAAGIGEIDRQHHIRAQAIADLTEMPVFNLGTHGLSARDALKAARGNLAGYVRQASETWNAYRDTRGFKKLGAQTLILGVSLGASGALTYTKPDGQTGGFHTNSDIIGAGLLAPANLQNTSYLDPARRLRQTPAAHYAETMALSRLRDLYCDAFGVDSEIENADQLMGQLTKKMQHAQAKVIRSASLTHAALGASLSHDSLGKNVSDFLTVVPQATVSVVRGVDDPITPALAFERVLNDLSTPFGERIHGLVVHRNDPAWELEADHSIIDRPMLLAHLARSVITRSAPHEGNNEIS
jgi:hypothetical protein